MTDGIANVAPAGLTREEAEFAYNCEVLGLPARKAAQMANLSLAMLSKPHLVQAREALRRQMRDTMQITKEDVVHGMREAVDRARLLGEPATEIMGWEKIAKLLGYDTPQKIDVNITASIDVLQKHVRGMSDADLAKLVDARDVIDGEFYAPRE